MREKLAKEGEKKGGERGRQDHRSGMGGRTDRVVR